VLDHGYEGLVAKEDASPDVSGRKQGPTKHGRDVAVS